MPSQDDAPLFAAFDPVERSQWLAAIDASLGGRAWQDLTKTRDGIDMPAVATAEDLSDIPHLGSLPGQAPYLRGVNAAGYLTEPWRIVGEITIADPAEWNRELTAALAAGQSAIFIGATPTLESATDIKTALKDVDLARLPLLIADGERALHLARWLQRARIAVSSGCIGYDPLHGLAWHGAMPQDAFERMARHAARLASLSPGIGSIAINADIYHDAGASAVQELAYVLATALHYLREMLDRDFDINKIAAGMHVFLTMGEDFFTEIARLRALRRLWARVMDVCGAGEAAQKLKLHAATGRRNTSVLDRHVNLLRATSAALAAVFGGVNSLRVLPFDAPSGTTSAFSRRLALNMQHIMAQEVGLTRLVDPAGGSWHIESLTDKLAKAAWKEFQDIEAAGGMLAALQSGQIQKQVMAVARERQGRVARRETLLIGCNAFPNLDETPQFIDWSNPMGAPDLPDDAIRIEPLQTMRAAEAWENLRFNVERYRKKHGHLPRIRLDADDKGRLAAARACLEAGGFDCIDDEGGGDALPLTLPSELDCLALNQSLQAQLGFDA